MSGPPEFDRLVHEPARLVLMANLSVVDEADFVFLSKQTGLTAGNISSHMAKLEEAGYVVVSKEFVGRKPRTIYRLTSSGREAFDRHRARLTEVLGQAG
jgi:DNA-binding MarR family transcriptional regulator